MTTKVCRVCTRTMDATQFRMLRNGVVQKLCKQCEQGHRRELKAIHRLPTVQPHDPLAVVFRDWAASP